MVLPAMVLPLAASFAYFVVFPGTTFGHACYAGIKVFLLLWPVLAIKAVLREPLMAREWNPPRHRASLWPGLAFGLVVVGAMIGLIEGTPLGSIVYDNGDRIATRVEDLGVADHFLAFALFISFAHAALEEYYWRWFVFGQLRRLVPLGAAHVLAALAFASHHVVILSQFFPLGWAFGLGGCVACGGLAWSWLYHRYGSLLGAWASHVVVDLGLMWVGWQVMGG